MLIKFNFEPLPALIIIPTFMVSKPDEMFKLYEISFIWLYFALVLEIEFVPVKKVGE